MHHGKPATTLSLLFIMKWFWLLSLVLWLLMTGIIKKLLVHLQKHWTINWHTQTYLYNVHGNAETHTNSTYITAIINRKMSELQFHQHIKKRLFPPVFIFVQDAAKAAVWFQLSGLYSHKFMRMSFVFWQVSRLRETKV